MRFRTVARTPGRAVAIEIPPKHHLISFNGTEYNIALPYVTIVAHKGDQPAIVVANEPATSLASPTGLPPLPNVYGNGMTCGINSRGKLPLDIVEAVFSTGFRGSLYYDVEKLPPVLSEVVDEGFKHSGNHYYLPPELFEFLQDVSIDDVCKMDWPTTELSYRGVDSGILGVYCTEMVDVLA